VVGALFVAFVVIPVTVWVTGCAPVFACDNGGINALLIAELLAVLIFAALAAGRLGGSGQRAEPPPTD